MHPASKATLPFEERSCDHLANGTHADHGNVVSLRIRLPAYLLQYAEIPSLACLDIGQRTTPRDTVEARIFPSRLEPMEFAESRILQPPDDHLRPMSNPKRTPPLQHGWQKRWQAERQDGADYWPVIGWKLLDQRGPPRMRSAVKGIRQPENVTRRHRSAESVGKIVLPPEDIQFPIPKPDEAARRLKLASDNFTFHLNAIPLIHIHLATQ